MGALFSRSRSPATELERISLQIGDLKQKLEKLSKKQSIYIYYYCMLIFTLVTVSIAHTWLRYDHPLRTYYVGALTIGAFALLFVGRYIIKSFFQWRTSSTSQKLEHTISQKGVLLDLVKDTLKFKEAKEILDRYDIKEDDRNMTMMNRSAPASPVINRQTKGDLNKTVIHTPKKDANKPESESPINPNASLNTTVRSPNLPPRNLNPNRNAGPIRPYLRQTGAVDRLLDYFMSDGPGCRNALICSICHTHNGMAIPAEYPFISFRCFECGHFNPSKVAPQNIPIRSPTNQAIIRPTVIADKKEEEKNKEDKSENDVKKEGETSKNKDQSD
ncbi:unnamed protein product [Caenorhabditis angaria]|uniref:Endoplasmic reticulum junction formation protein lunapark n=1 Tax=Caenorhabditis angaria TaxID=860376 RepID=A0A9P1J3L4_9PELO|nr:unnamed protein product [Caenorhabditis angaria]